MEGIGEYVERALRKDMFYVGGGRFVLGPMKHGGFGKVVLEVVHSWP